MGDKSGFGQLGLGLAGAFVGSMFGYPQLGFIGGALLGTYLFAQKSDTGDMPNLASMPIQRSNKGTPVPIVYGTARAAGNIIWMGDLVPYTIKHSAGGGKGGLAGGSASTTETRYRRSFLIGICQGPATIGRAWKGKVEISTDEFTHFAGAANIGIGLLTGEDFSEHKHTLCAFFTDYDLGGSQAIPNFIFEVNSTSSYYPTLQLLTAAEIPTKPVAPADAVGSSPIHIGDKTDLAAITTGNDYILDNDIDCGGGAWTPITDMDGVLEGAGYTISGIAIDEALLDSQALFTTISTGARIQNLAFEDCSVTGRDYTAILCAKIDGQSDIVLKNIDIKDCILSCDEEGGMLIGQVVNSLGQIKAFDCIASGRIEARKNRGSYIGMLIGGWFMAVAVAIGEKDYIVDCHVRDYWGEGSGSGVVGAGFYGLDQAQEAGGLIGKGFGRVSGDIARSVLVLHTCSSDVTIDFIQPYISCCGVFSGILGPSVEATSCEATGDITCWETSGEVVNIGGWSGEVDSRCTLVDCHSHGDVILNELYPDAGGTGAGTDWVGGFIGFCYNYMNHFLRCYTTSTITVNNSYNGGAQSAIYCGGFIGTCNAEAVPGENYEAAKISGGFIERCWCEGDIFIKDVSMCGSSNGEGVGAFIGGITSGAPIIENCYSWSSITGDPSSLTDNGSSAQGIMGGCIGSMHPSFLESQCYVTNYYHASPGLRDGIQQSLVNDNRGGLLAFEGLYPVYADSCFWDSLTDNVYTDESEIRSGATAGAVGHPTFRMWRITNYTSEGWDVETTAGDTDVSIWYMPEATSGDENPSFIIRDLLTNPIYGAEVSEPTYIDTVSFDEIYDYCEDEDYLISVLIDETKFVGDWIDFINSHFRGYIFMSEGKIKLGAFREQTPISPGIVQSDLVVEPGPNPSPPVRIVKRSRNQTFNRVEVTWENRSKDYDMCVAEARDEVDQRVTRKITKKTIELTGIKREVLANKMRWYLLFDSMYRFSILNFTLSYKSMLWEQGDVTTITDGYLLTDFRIRILSIRKAKDGRTLQVEAIEDVPSLYTAVEAILLQTTDRTPDVEPAVVNSQIAVKENPDDRILELSMTPGSANANGWDLYRSYDNITYDFVGRTVIDGVTGGDANATGTLTNRLIAYPVGCHRPLDVLKVDIGTVVDLDTSITDDDFFDGRKTLKIGNEIIGYKTCVETTTEGIWEITGLLRGMNNTLPVAHEVGETMQTLTNDFTYVYQESDIGKIIYFKAVTFYGSVIEDISDVTEIAITVSGFAFKPLPVSLMRIQNRDYKSTYKTDDVNIIWEFCSKTTGFGRGGYGQALWGSYTEDTEQLAQIKVELEDEDGVAITEDTYDLADFGNPPVLEILIADRSGNNPIKVKLTPGSNLLADETRDITITKI